MLNLKQGTPSAKEDSVVSWILLGILLISLSVTWWIFAGQVSRLEASTVGLNYVEYISSSTQRLVKLELTGSPNDELIFNLDNVLYEIAPVANQASEYFYDDENILAGISDMVVDWQLLKSELQIHRLDGTSTGLLSASERHFYHAANLSNYCLDYVNAQSSRIVWLQVFLMGQMIALVFIVGHHLFVLFVELKQNKAISQQMFIDASTGLYNRSKCQEMLRNPATPADPKSRAMVVFDLNDLKKTNDQYGHRVGDDLIYNFAQVIKNAGKVCSVEPFIGRYGGDEFIVFFDKVETYEVKDYLDEVAFLAEAFNVQENKYQISYAAGQAVFSKEKGHLTMRQLFDQADKHMYINKVAMKEKKAEEQGRLSPN